jgi:competence protein ComEC
LIPSVPFSKEEDIIPRKTFFMKKIKLPAFVYLLFSLFFLQAAAQKMTAHFIDIGQGDATLLEFPCGVILIDAGAQGSEQEQKLVAYLSDFFDHRPDLHRTIDLVIITHPHLDHNLALDNVADSFTIKKYIDNGQKTGSGKKNQTMLQRTAAAKGIVYANYTYKVITANGNKQGVTDTIIDPLHCGSVDPKIILLSGRFPTRPAGWSRTNYKNLNNHSIVIKVIFDHASFLFTGDLEEDGISQLLKTYNATNMLDVDILRVGHHGSDNAITTEFINAVTPSHAVISCGQWYYGRGTSGKFNTYSYGHPRISTLDLLSTKITGERSTPVIIKAAEKAKTFKNYIVKKRIYGTAWDHTIQIEAGADGQYRVTRDN